MRFQSPSLAAIISFLGVGTCLVSAGPALGVGNGTAPTFEAIHAPDDDDVLPARDGAPIWFTAADDDGVRQVSARWCHQEVVSYCVSATSMVFDPGQPRVQSTLWTQTSMQAPPGSYALQELVVEDQAGEAATYRPDGSVTVSPSGTNGPTAHGFDLTQLFVLLDAEVPQVTDVSWPGGVAAYAVEDTLGLDVAVSDNYRGPLTVQVWFQQGTYQLGPATGQLPDSGQAGQAGVVRVTYDLPWYTIGGQWQIERIEVRDQQHNRAEYLADGKLLTQTGLGSGTQTHSLPLSSMPLTVRNPSPTLVGGIPGDMAMTARWNAAADRDGTPPAEYDVTVAPADPDDVTSPRASATVDGSQTQKRFTGLRNGIPYIVRVRSRFADGREFDAPAPSHPWAPYPIVSVSPEVRVVEGDVGTSAAVLTIRLSSPSAVDTTLCWETADGTATASRDYTAVRRCDTVSAGDVSTQIRVPVAGDTRTEGEEQFWIRFPHNTFNGESEIRVVKVVIVDDDPDNTAALSVGAVTSIGGKRGTAPGVFTIRLARPRAHPVTVRYLTRDGTAIAALDYRATQGQLRFRAGEVVKYVAVPIHSRATRVDSTFTLRLRAPEGAPIAKRSGRGGIVR